MNDFSSLHTSRGKLGAQMTKASSSTKNDNEVTGLSIALPKGRVYCHASAKHRSCRRRIEIVWNRCNIVRWRKHVLLERTRRVVA